MHLIAPLAKQPGDLIAGFMLFKTNFRLLVKATTEGNKLRFINL